MNRIIVALASLLIVTTPLAGCLEDLVDDIVGCMDNEAKNYDENATTCLLYTSPSPRDQRGSRMPSSA